MDTHGAVSEEKFSYTCFMMCVRGRLLKQTFLCPWSLATLAPQIQMIGLVEHLVPLNMFVAVRSFLGFFYVFKLSGCGSQHVKPPVDPVLCLGFTDIKVKV